MTLQEYYNKLTYFVNNHPEALDLEVVTYDCDWDRSSGVNPNFSLGFNEGRDFIHITDFEKYGIDAETVKANAVCIN